VLKRFTFTEEDADYQWEKLRSAYMLAEWSEEYFNNRALFSDYYLKERLTDPKITPEWNEDVRPVGREIYNHIITARKNYTRQTEEVIRRGLYKPVFKLLGFDFAKQKSSASAAAAADYLLYTPGDKSKPIAAALTYVWNRNLDDVDESREGAEEHNIELDARWKLLTGSDIDRYYTEQSPPHEILFVDWDFDAKSHPNTIRYLENFATKLSQRREAKQGKMPWIALHWPRYIELYDSPKIICRQTADTLIATVDTYNYCALNSTIIIKPDAHDYSPYFWIAILNSGLQAYIYNLLAQEEDRAFAEVKPTNLRKLPIRRITFTTSVNERERLTREIVDAYDLGDNAGVLQRVQVTINTGKTDVVHDLLAHLAQRMIDLNKQKQGEVKRFLGWLEKRLQIRPDKNGATGIGSLTGKTILQGYLGDYQKGEDDPPWREFYYRLYQNRNRFAISLSEVDGEIQREYEKSLATLLPIKSDLARTDVLIDKIVYRLYGLTDEEIELIERPQYEQALADAKAQVVADEAITVDEEKIEKIAEGILPAARRFFERVDPTSVEELLTASFPTGAVCHRKRPHSSSRAITTCVPSQLTWTFRRVSSHIQRPWKWC
jgi:TaqI-like C-terminal specificity domain